MQEKCCKKNGSTRQFLICCLFMNIVKKKWTKKCKTTIQLHINTHKHTKRENINQFLFPFPLSASICARYEENIRQIVLNIYIISISKHKNQIFLESWSIPWCSTPLFNYFGGEKNKRSILFPLLKFRKKKESDIQFDQL